MPSELADKFALIGVPYLQEAWVGPHCEVVPSVWPLHAGDCVWGAQVIEFSHLAWGGWPEVDTGTQTHCEDVGGRPVNKVEVKVILEGRGI